jgi:hypothetical protein
MKPIAPLFILQASSNPILSLCVSLGGIKYMGNTYTYIAQKDALLKESLVSKYKSFKGSWDEFLKTI